MMTEKPPKGLQAAGRRLWRDVESQVELDPGDYDVLLAACRLADDLARLTAVSADVEPVVKGSTGQERMHPIYDEIRRHADLQAKLVGQLKPVDGAKQSASQLASHAALRRWNPNLRRSS